MSEIEPRHMEWMTVRRMSEMLGAPALGYEVTHSLAMFHSIVGWTVQRIRTTPHGPKDARDKLRQAKRGDRFAQGMWDLQDWLLHRPAREVFARLPADFPECNDDRMPISALDALVAIRNGLCHGDGRQIVPYNLENRLLGYRVLHRSGKDFGRWQATVTWDMKAMTEAGDILARLFCDAIISFDDARDQEIIARLKEAA